VLLEDLDAQRCLVRLREKVSPRWQPISPTPATCLLDHAAARSAVLPTDQVLRYRTGHPITTRRYDHPWRRLGQQLPWVGAQGVSTTGCAIPPSLGSNATSPHTRWVMFGRGGTASVSNCRRLPPKACTPTGLRHTTLTWVERHLGYGITRAYAGHTDSTGPATTTYIKPPTKPPPRWPP
jgi:integrase